MSRLARMLFVTVIVAALAGLSVVPVAARSGTDRAIWEDAPVWIVRLQPGASIDEILSEKLQGRSEFLTQRYSQIINGFAARMPAEFAEALKADSRVLAIQQDFEVYASAQTIPTGISRINATQNATADIDGVDERVNVDVAVLDTGVSAQSDLNVAGGVDCTGSGSWSDGNGHGTHVAGTIGALDNGAGVVGVAPGARIWSVRVLNSQGSGYGSWILCGIDWVTANAGTIEVANMSLGGKTSYVDDNNCGRANGDVMHQAICESVDAGVTYVVAAGNDGADAAGYFPASYNEVITVSALVDTDGKAGGLGAGTSVGADDTLASFSNVGPDVDVIAPGVNIVSTSRTGGLQTMSGTSMASPHVAGAAALYKAVNPSASPSAVRSALIASSSSTAWTGDRDSTKEPLIDTANGGETPPPPTTVIDAQAVSVSAPASVNRGATATVNVTVKNNGAASATISVALSETPGGFAQTRSIALAAGASGRVGYSWATTSTTATGTHTFTASVSLTGDSNAGNNSATATTSVVVPATPTMSVSNLKLTSTRLSSYYRLMSQVTVKSNGAAVSSATVSVEFRYPNGARYTMSGRTGSSGVVTFTRNVTAKGSYTVTIASVSKAGLTYNAAGNVVSSTSVTVR